MVQSAPRKGLASRKKLCVNEESEGQLGLLNRRAAMVTGVSLLSSVVFGFPGEVLAVVKQGPLAGRIPGLSEPNEQG